MQASHFGFRIAEVPARTRYFDDASSIGLGPATVYGLKTLWAAARLIAAPVAESCARASSRRDDHRRAGHHAGGRVQPDLAAPRRRLLRSARPSSGQGRVLDLGCGVGHSYALLAPRETVGVDVDAERAGRPGARDARGRHARAALPGRRASPSVLAVHSIEHVPDPERVLAEVARVLEPGGAAVFVTPNRLTFARPDEIIDPYHYVEYDPGELAAAVQPRVSTAWRCTGCSARTALPRAGRRAAAPARPPAAPGTRCACGGWCPAGCASASTTAC